MKININPDEARMVLNHRAWNRLFRTKGRSAELVYFIVMSPPIITVFSTTLLFVPNINNVVPSVFLAFGLICLPFTFKALKRFKVLQTEIQTEMINEERQNREEKNG